MVMTLGDGHRVVIRLASAYAPEHVANLKRLAKARWWDGESVYRVQENWVAQWGDPTEKKPLAAAIVARPAAEYEIAARSEEHTSELQSLMRISYAVFCLKKHNRK